jgi:hypothetical protein
MWWVVQGLLLLVQLVLQHLQLVHLVTWQQPHAMVRCCLLCLLLLQQL